MENKKKRLAVIGTGFSGLSVLRHFTTIPPLNYEVCAFEKESDIGGLWRIPGSWPDWDTATRLHERQKYNPVYDNLESNSPSFIMELEGLSYPKQEGTGFVKPHDVMKYFTAFADKFNLRQYIKFRHEVISVSPIVEKDPLQTRWRVLCRNLETRMIVEGIFDAVAVCNGHFNKSYLPPITGLDKFKGEVIHSCQYRSARDYKDKTVLIIGGNYSGKDVASLLLNHAKKIIIARRKNEPVFQPFPNVLETYDIKGFDEENVYLNDGSKEQIDCVIACTGYDYDFPFLSPDCHVKITNNRVTPLYQHAIHIEFPTMGFIGILDEVLYTPVIDFQVKFFKAFLDGKMKLPSREEMIASSDEDFAKKLKEGERHAHKIYLDAWDYFDKLAADAGFPTYEPVLKKVFDSLVELATKQPYNFRKYKFEKIDADEYSITRPNYDIITNPTLAENVLKLMK